jgi:predicted phage tail protein
MSHDELIVVVKDDPFSDRPPRLIQAEAGTPISELVDMAGFEQIALDHAEASINGEAIDAELWAETPGRDHVQIVVLPRGGDDGNKLLRTVLTIAVIVAAFYLGPEVAAIFAAEGTKAFAAISYLTTAVVTTVGQLAINSIVPPPSFEFGEQPDPVYFIEGIRNQLFPLQPVQTVLGRHRIVPRLGARAYPEIRGDDTYYYIVVELGPIDVEVTDRKVGDTPLANIDGVVYQSRLVPTDPHPTMASRQTFSESVGATLLESDPEVRRTASDVIDCDLIFAFPQGLGGTNKKGNPTSQSVNVQVRYREVINPGPSETFGDWRFASARTNAIYPEFRGFENLLALSGGGIGGDPNFGTSASFRFVEAKPAQPFFRQVGFSFPSEGTYEVEVLRISPDSNDAREFDDIVWQTILSKRDEPVINRDDVAYEVYRFKGTDETSGAIDELNMVVGRWIPAFPDSVLDQADLSGVTAADLSVTKVSSNPWEQSLWIMRNGFNAREAVTDDGFDWPSFAAAAKDARDRGLKFDYVVRQNVTVGDLGNLVASSGGEGRIYSYNNIWTAGVDRPIPAPSHVFRDGTARNISSTKSFPEEVHAFIVTFNDANNGWRTREVTIYVDGFTKATATKFERISIPGKTDWDDLHRAILQLYRNSRLQSETTNLEVPKDSLDNTLRPMGRISVASRVITQVQGSGILRGITTSSGQVTEVELDQELNQGPSYPGLALKWVNSDGTLSDPAPLVIPGSDGLSATATLDTPVAEAGGPVAGADYIIGPIGTDLFEGLLETAEDAGDEWIRLSLKSYAPARFDETGSVIPPYAIEPVLPLGSSPPTPVFVSAEASNFKITVTFTVPEGYPQPLREIRVWRAYAAPDDDPDPDALSVFEQLPSLGPEVRQLIDAPGQVGQRIVYRFQTVAVTGRTSPVMETPYITVADVLPFANNFAAVGGTETGSNGVINPVIEVTWDPDDDIAIQEAVIEARVVAKDVSDVRLPDASQPDYTPVTNIPAIKGRFTIRGVPPGVDMDVQMFYRGRRGEIGTAYEVRDVAVPDGAAGTTGSVDWGNIIGTPLELVDGRVGAGLDASGDLARPIPVATANSSGLLRYTGGALYTGSLDADRTAVNIAAGFIGQGDLASEDAASDRAYANFIVATSGIGYTNSEFNVNASDQVCGVDNIYREKAFATVSCDGSPVEIMFTAFFGEGAPNTSSEAPELTVSALIRRVEGTKIISQGSHVAVLRADAETGTSRSFGGTFRVVDDDPGGTPANPVNRTYQIFFATTRTSPKPPADFVAILNPNIWSGMRLTVHRENANNIT